MGHYNARKQYRKNTCILPHLNFFLTVGSRYLLSVCVSMAAMDTHNRAVHINTGPSAELYPPACETDKVKVVLEFNVHSFRKHLELSGRASELLHLFTQPTHTHTHTHFVIFCSSAEQKTCQCYCHGAGGTQS